MNSVSIFEDLAAVPDSALHGLINGRELRQRAIRWVEHKEKNASTDKLKEEIAALKKTVAALSRAAKPAKPRSPEIKAKQSATMKAKHEAKMVAEAQPADVVAG